MCPIFLCLTLSLDHVTICAHACACTHTHLHTHTFFFSLLVQFSPANLQTNHFLLHHRRKMSVTRREKHLISVLRVCVCLYSPVGLSASLRLFPAVSSLSVIHIMQFCVKRSVNYIVSLNICHHHQTQPPIGLRRGRKNT